MTRIKFCYGALMFRRIRQAWHLYKFAARDARTPFSAKLLPWLSIAYVFWPIDIIPDLIPLLGFGDDLVVFLALVLWAFRLIPNDVKKEARSKIIDI